MHAGVEMALIVSVFYWLFISVDGVDVNTHLVNAIVALIDIFVSGVPIRVYFTFMSQCYLLQLISSSLEYTM